MYSKILYWAAKIENLRILSSVRKGFILMVPVFLIGSISTLIRNFPLDFWQNFIIDFNEGIIDRICLFVFDSTLGFISAYVILSISYYYSYSLFKKGYTLQMLAMITSLICFIASFGGENGSLQVSSFGPIGVFWAILCALVSTFLFYTIYRRVNKEFHVYTAGGDMQYHNAFLAIIPMVSCIAVFILANLILKNLLNVNDFNELISNGLVSLFQHVNGEPENGILFVFLLSLLWVFGIHGGNALNDVSTNVFLPADLDPNILISKSFLDNFALLGGSGATICLLLALLITSTSKNTRSLAKTSAPLAIFNINEMLIFGLPTVLNPAFVIPFIIVPICSVLIAYVATISGFMPAVTASVDWTTPVFFSGYLATGSKMAIVVQLIIVAVGTLIYIPFVKFAEDVEKNRLNLLFEELVEHFKEEEKLRIHTKYLYRNDSLGAVAKIIITELKKDIKNENIKLHYQPQFDRSEKITGAEALLRWKFKNIMVYPPLLIALAKEDNIYQEFTRVILKTACKDIAVIRESIKGDFDVAVNISADQLNDKIFIEQVINLAKEYEVCGGLELEVTEETSLAELKNISENIERLRQNQILMSMDDFGAGQTAISYLQNYKFKFVKLDGDLVKQVPKNQRSRDIISSIIFLGESLGFKITAEYVENKEVRDILLNLGCHIFQGYYYSPAIPVDEFLEFCESRSI